MILAIRSEAISGTFGSVNAALMACFNKTGKQGFPEGCLRKNFSNITDAMKWLESGVATPQVKTVSNSQKTVAINFVCFEKNGKKMALAYCRFPEVANIRKIERVLYSNDLEQEFVDVMAKGLAKTFKEAQLKFVGVKPMNLKLPANASYEVMNEKQIAFMQKAIA